LKEIEKAAIEVSALDHEHWEKKAFIPLEDPEYTAVVSGRIEWSIDNYNGTKEKPNREIVMKSEPVNIGGYDWQIKFYPKGNDSDYLSVYVECLSVGGKKEKKEEDSISEPVPKEDEEMATGDDEGAIPAEPPVESAPEVPQEPQHCPLPLLDSKTVPKRKSVAAQVSVVLYNPSEPRVNYSRTCLHRFCAKSPDWGWTRYHGPYYDIPHRIRGQRQALLRDDKLAFTGYIRIVDDETSNLWEHNSRDNPWDSFAMTGLQSMTIGEGTGPSVPGGNIISAVASWILFKPIRTFLYGFVVPDSENEPFVRPKPLIAALQKVLYMLRTQVAPGAGSVALDDILEALEWYGIHERLDKLDVIEVWEILRLKVEDELQGTQYANIFEKLCGIKRDYALGTPSYRVPVMGVSTMQEAVDKSPDLTVPKRQLPQLLTIELERQEFDVATRSYVKLLNKVSLDDHIKVRGTPYTLYGFIVHKQTLQSYVYHPVLRPEGPGSKWYSYSDGKEDYMVKCLTKRQAVDAHEGKPGTEKIVGNEPVAYIAMYIRDDIAKSAFVADAESEQWKVPDWLRKEVAKQQAGNIPPRSMPPIDIPIPEPPKETEEEAKPVEEPEPQPEPPQLHDFQVIDSRVFAENEGPGTFDAYDTKWQSGNSDLIYSVQLAVTDGCKEIREKLATVVKDIKDPRQIKFWFLDPLRGSFGRPNLLGTGRIEYSSGSMDHYADPTKEWTIQDSPSWTSSRIWIHVLDPTEVRELPKAPEPVPEPVPEPIQEPIPEPVAEIESPASVSEAPVWPDSSIAEILASTQPEIVAEPQSEDTPMSDPDEPAPTQIDSQAEAQPETQLETQTVAQPAVEPEVQLESQIEALPNTEPEVQPEVQHEIQPEAQVEAPPQEVQTPAPQVDIEPTDTAMEVEVEEAVEPTPTPAPADVSLETNPGDDIVLPDPPVVADVDMGGTQEDLLPPPPLPPVDFPSEPPPPPAEIPPPPPPDEIYFFLKFFNAEAQTLEPRGSHIALKSDRVDVKVSSLLGLPSDQKVELYEEDELTTTHPIRNRRSFAQNDLHNTTIIIASLPITEEQRNALAVKALFADPQAYLGFRSHSRNFPARLTGHFTYNYFSSQYYKGEIKNGHRHGHGMRIYHSGATYEGNFRLSLRHGHGLYTFQNGDTYDGDWVANQQHGSGTFVEASTGNTYVGGWKNDKKFGEGVTHWKNAQETERLCRICWEESADAAFYDCGHVVACLACARRVEACPVCRKRVLAAMKLYYVS
jgi:hypothetical protein